MISVRKVTAANISPLTLAEAKAQLRIDASDNSENQHILDLCLAAADRAETRTNRAFMQSTWRLTNRDFELYPLDSEAFYRLLPGPLVSVTSVQYYSGGNLQTLSTSLYKVDTACIPGRIQFLGGLPQSIDEREDAVQINFVAGYGAASASEAAQQAAVPPEVKIWLRFELATLYEIRQNVVVGATVNPVNYAESFLTPYILVGP